MIAQTIEHLSEVAALGTPVRVVDPQTQAAFVLLSSEQYERVRSLLGGDDFEAADAYPLMDEVARSEGWDDPGLDIYNQFREQRQ